MRSHAKAATAGSNRPRAGKLVLAVVAFAALLALVLAGSVVAAVPTVTTDPATNSTGTKATLNGTVNPEGEELSECKFEWGEGFAFDQVAICAESLPTIGSGTSPVAVHADISSLQPNGTEYRFRLVATNPSGTVSGFQQSFTTPDTVITTAPSAVTTTAATLNGTVNPDGVAMTECLFEWGETTAYGNTVPCVPNAAGIGSGTSPVAVSADISGLDVGTPYHYRLKAANANGPILGQDMTVQALGPRIVDSWSQGVAFTEAVLRAEIDPEGLATTYRFEYGTTEAYGSETPELSVGSDSSVHLVSRFLEGLQPGTTYHYRVVATNADATNVGPDHTLTTFEHLVPQTDCPNQEFRIGLSGQLPDCRAYEMVSPVDKAGADIEPPINITGYTMASDQAALDGEKITFTTRKPFGDALSSLWANQFIARRGASGWSTHGINPPHENNRQLFFDAADVPGRYSAFSEDLSTAFLLDDAKPPLTPDALTGHKNFYLRDNLTESYEALTTQLFAPADSFSSIGGMGFQGYSADGSHTLFSARAALTADAGTHTNPQLYDYHDGELELVSILPGGDEPAPGESSAGGAGGSGFYNAELGETQNAISDDGSRIFWMTGMIADRNIGKIYARLDGATTIPVSESVSAENNSTYWGAAADGSQVVFNAGSTLVGTQVIGSLYRFDVDTETPNEIAGEVDRERGVLGVSDDASHVYFLSKEALAPGATAGQSNLYLDQEGSKTFIATLDPADEVGPAPTATSDETIRDFSRVTPDGRHLVFQSRASLTGYDNTSLDDGTAAIEVFRYDADVDQLLCVSCNPSGGRPEAENLEQPHAPGTGGGFFPVQAAAWLPTPRRTTHIPRMLADDGSYLYFNARDALVPQDANGAQDVYQWVEQGVGACAEADGCVSLISTGTNPEESEFIDASAGGQDVFVRTSASIDPADKGLIDVYDARVGGGFPFASTAPPCVGDACQSVPEPPNDPTPASASFRGAGDPVPGRPRRSCRARAKRSKAGKAGKQKARRCKRNNRRAGR